MRRPSLLLAVPTLAALALAGCASDDDVGSAAPTTTEASPGDQGAEEEGEGAEVAMTDADGNDVGAVTLTTTAEGVRVDARLEGLDPGFHGFHVHDVGLCAADAPDGPFTTAMGHFVGEGGSHGDHDGDMPSLFVTDDGAARLSVDLDTFTVEELTEGDGAAVMIHAGADNFANLPDRYTSSESGQPGADDMTKATGDAGARAACGVVGSPASGT